MKYVFYAVVFAVGFLIASPLILFLILIVLVYWKLSPIDMIVSILDTLFEVAFNKDQEDLYEHRRYAK